MMPPLIYNTLQVVLHNISQEDMEQGQVQYVMHGKDLEKNRCALTPDQMPSQTCYEALQLFP